MRDRPTKDHRPPRPAGRPQQRSDARTKGSQPPRKEAASRGAGSTKKPGAKFAAKPRSTLEKYAATKKHAAGEGVKPTRKPRDLDQLERRTGGKTKAAAPPFEAAESDGAQRIAKVMARAGLCSRRTAESWIESGRVALNGALVTDPAVNVGPDDKIMVDDAPLAQRARTRLFLFHKPRGLVSTERDPEGRSTVFDYLREHWPEGPRVVSVGRLDINTEGLLLLTNDGGLARVLELPETGWVRRYRVRAKGETDQAILDRLREGVSVDGVNYAGIEAKLDREQGANSWLTLGLREGKNREIKRVLEHLGLVVNRLIRLSFGPFQLGELAEGAVEEVRMRVLRDQLGPSLAKAARVDFSSPAEEPIAAPERIEGPRRERPQASGADRGRGAQRSPREGKPRDIGAREQAPAPETRGKPRPGPRKHVSTLRAEDMRLSGARKRVERRETEDRSGRTIQIERLVPAAPERTKQAALGLPATRNARRFEAERKSREEALRPARRPASSARPASAAGVEGSRGERRTRWDKSAAPGGRAPKAERFEGSARAARSKGAAEGSAEGPRGERRTRSDKAAAPGAREPRAERFKGSARAAKPKGPAEGGAKAAGPTHKRSSSTEGAQDKRRSFSEKTSAQGGGKVDSKRFAERPRSSRPANKAKDGRPARSGDAKIGGRPHPGNKPGGKSAGKPGGRSGPRQGGGSGKGRPQGKR
ncbi:pseudouridine synthase [Methylocapsa acidiphila]|uniref:pseudouridine synthase n=1 Tax=Methylocapsa acidiphila TaxID=133552 RepID=UPI0006851F66|nr:pseudouridine synthase [Methylocapsa acidiphila]